MRQLKYRLAIKQNFVTGGTFFVYRVEVCCYHIIVRTVPYQYTHREVLYCTYCTYCMTRRAVRAAEGSPVNSPPAIQQKAVS